MVVSEATIPIWCPLGQSIWRKSADYRPGQRIAVLWRVAVVGCRLQPCQEPRHSEFSALLLASCLGCSRHRQRFTTIPANGCQRLGVQVVAGLRSPAGLPPTAGALVCQAHRPFAFPLPGPLTNTPLEGLQMKDAFKKSRLLWRTHLARIVGFGTIHLVSEPGGNK